VYLARVLGVSGFGVLEFAGAVLTYFLLLADSGLELLGTREAARTGDIRALAARLVPLRLLLATGSFALLLLFLPLFPDAQDGRLVLALFGGTLFAQSVSLKWVFLGREQMARVARGLVIAQVMFAGTVFALVRSPEALLLVPLFRFAGEWAAALYFAFCFHREHGGIRFPLTLRGARDILRPAITIGANQAMGLLNFSFDSVLLGFLRGATVVGWYGAAYKPVTVALALPMTYFSGLFPALSRTYAEDRKAYAELVGRSLQVCFTFAVPLVVGTTLLARPLIDFLYGPAYAPSVLPLQILIWSAALVIVRNTYAHSLIATGHQNLDLRCGIASAATNVVLNLLLIPRFGMVGAASATVTADVVWNVMAYYYFRRAVLAAPPPIPWKGPVVAAALMAVFLLVAAPLPWIPRAAAAAILYFGVLALFPHTVVRHWLHSLRTTGS
jgi:O-antigen/teichoic acid export membrane protein